MKLIGGPFNGKNLDEVKAEESEVHGEDSGIYQIKFPFPEKVIIREKNLKTGKVKEKTKTEHCTIYYKQVEDKLYAYGMQFNTFYYCQHGTIQDGPWKRYDMPDFWRHDPYEKWKEE